MHKLSNDKTGNGTVLSLQWKDLNSGQKTSQSLRGSQGVLKNGDQTVPTQDASKNASQSVLDDLSASKNSAQIVPFAQGSSKANRWNFSTTNISNHYKLMHFSNSNI